MDPRSNPGASSNGDGSGNTPAGNTRVQVQGQDPRADYSLSLQKACDVAVRRVQTTIVSNRNLEAALVTAPSAVGVMAILLKAAGMDAAAGLEVESQEVKDERGAKHGDLPSKYFHTNLQHCSDIGRLAFLDAEMGMGTIMVAAQSMLTELGPVAEIINLLEDPEDARYNLMPRIGDIKRVAEKCLQNAEAVKSKFEYWYLVIIHLKQTSLTKRGEVIKQQEDTKAEQSKARAAESGHREKINASERQIKMLEESVKDAQAEVRRYEREADKLRDLPITPEPAVLEELQRIEALYPETPLPQAHKNRGILGEVKVWLVGESSHDDMDRMQAHRERIQKLRDKAMEQATEQRTRQRKEAAERLDKAVEMEMNSIAKLESARESLRSEVDQLAEARASLAKTQVDLGELIKKGNTLEGTMEILQQSITALGKMKENIEQLVEFFKSNLIDVQASIEYSVDPFLSDVERGLKKGANPEEVQEINLSGRSKQRVLSLALQMQGRFAAIADISAGYVAVSKNYIRPIINEMESLSIVGDSEWERGKGEFDAKCRTAMDDIVKLARELDTHVKTNIASRIHFLKGLAIEAAGAN
ncbi:hypothetical protein TWF696_006491 [Orbilia brochopaga]|uniref:Uncharacterized protein n=1 Tax=Orbilia brochopaga TaxID=3140254 RepID=A0AAV9UZS7_9PEZI